jgi:hypothetical protein
MQGPVEVVPTCALVPSAAVLDRCILRSPWLYNQTAAWSTFESFHTSTFHRVGLELTALLTRCRAMQCNTLSRTLLVWKAYCVG